MTALPENRELFDLRAMIDSDRAMIASSWLKNFRPASPEVSPLVYANHQSRLIDRLIERNSAVVACSPQDGNHIYGWICGAVYMMTDPVIHYVYVKRAMREFGIGKRLVAEMTKGGARPLFTHLPPVGRKDKLGAPDGFQTREELLEALAPGAIYCPYLLWDGKP